MIFLPIFIPLLTGILLLLSWKRLVLQRVISTVGNFALLAATTVLLEKVQRDGIQVAHVGGWPAPFGITLVADLLSALLLFVSAILATSIAVFTLGVPDERREEFGHHPLFQFLLVGVFGAFLAGDIFNLYVWYEVMLISSFVLLALGGERAQLEGAIKYVTINLVASTVFLAAAGIIYGFVGTLNMADLSVQLRASSNHGLVNVIAVFLLVCFGIKAAVFPLFFWLPASYHTPPSAISALFAGLLTKVGLYSIVRVFTLLFVGPGPVRTLILGIACFSMVVGVLGAAAQSEFRRTLSFHIISQIGYMLLGVALYTPLAMAGSVFFIIHNMFAKTNLFLVSGAVYKLRHSYEYKKLGGVFEHHPFLSCLFLISALSLAGVPPLSGFWGKLALIKAALDVEAYVVTAAAVGVSFMTLYSMTKIWGAVFWGEEPAREAVSSAAMEWRVLVGPIAVLAGCTLALSFFPEGFFSLMERTAAELLDPNMYVTAVLGRGPRG